MSTTPILAVDSLRPMVSRAGASLSSARGGDAVIGSPVIQRPGIPTRPPAARRRLECPLGGWLAVLAVVLPFLLGAKVAWAQTAHSVGEVTTFGANLNNPHAVVADPAGNLYIADYADGIVYQETPNGGTGNYAQSVLFSGLGHAIGLARDGDGNFYIAAGSGLLYKETPAVGGVYTQSTLGHFNDPVGVAVDAAGDLFVVDDHQSSLYELAAGTYAQTTIDNGGLATPYAVSIDAAGNLYVGNVRGPAIDKYTLANGTYTKSAVLEAPDTYGAIADGVGDLYYASPGQFLKATLIGGAYDDQVYYPYRAQALAEDANGALYVVSYFESTGIRLNPAPSFGAVPVGSAAGRQISLSFTVDTAGTFGTPAVLTQGVGGLDFTLVSTTCSGALAAQTSCTVTVAFTPTVPGLRSGGVTLLGASGNVLASAPVSGTGVAPQGVIYLGTQTTVASGLAAGPVATDAAGNLYAANGSGSLVKETLTAGGYTQTAFGSGIVAPAALAVDGLGNVFIADSAQGQVEEELLDPVTGAYTQIVPFTAAANGLGAVAAVAVDGGGTVYLGNGAEVLKEVPNGRGYVESVVAGGFTRIAALALDSSGALYIGDAGANSIFKETPGASGGYTPNYMQSTVATGLGGVNSLALDAAGTVYVTAPGTSDAVLRYAPDGSGSYTALSGVGSFGNPGGMALDAYGNLYVTGILNGVNILSRLDVADPETLSFPATPAGKTGPVQTAVLTNIGNAALGLAGLGTSSANFTLDPAATTCSSSTALGAAGTCQVGVAFTPQLAGPLTGTANLTDNTLNRGGSVQLIQLNGAGIAGPVTLTVSSISVVYGTGSVTLTATVSYAGTVAPGGAFTFAVDSRAPVTAACSGTGSPLTCTAIYPTAALLVGGHTIKAAMAADAYYLAAAGAGTLNVTALPVYDFSLTSSGTTSSTVTAGDAAGFSFVLAPLGSGYPGEVTLSVNGLPPGATYTLTPASVNLGAGSQTVQLSIGTVAAQAARAADVAPDAPHARWPRGRGVILAMLALPLCLAGRGRVRLGRALARSVPRTLALALVAVGGLAAMGVLTGCGFSGVFYGAPASYVITVTATSGSVQHTATVHLTVQ